MTYNVFGGTLSLTQSILLNNLAKPYGTVEQLLAQLAELTVYKQPMGSDDQLTSWEIVWKRVVILHWEISMGNIWGRIFWEMFGW